MIEAARKKVLDLEAEVDCLRQAEAKEISDNVQKKDLGPYWHDRLHAEEKLRVARAVLKATEEAERGN